MNTKNYSLCIRARRKYMHALIRFRTFVYNACVQASIDVCLTETNIINLYVCISMYVQTDIFVLCKWYRHSEIGPTVTILMEFWYSNNKPCFSTK